MRAIDIVHLCLKPPAAVDPQIGTSKGGATAKHLCRADNRYGPVVAFILTG